MMHRLLALFSALLLVSAICFAGGNKVKIERNIMHEGQSGAVRSTNSTGEELRSTAVTWVAVDTQANAFGPASRGVKALAYDPATNWLGHIHRGKTPYATGSGQLWYNRSINGGTTWRRVGELNAGTGALARYPSCAIANPANNADTTQALFVHANPALNPTAFGWMMYGVDALGAASPYAVIDRGDTTSYWSNVQIWSGAGNPWVYWALREGGTKNDYKLWRTTDYATVFSGVPTAWSAAQFSVHGQDIAGTVRGTTSYFSAWNVFTGEAGDVYSVGYSKSTDNGATWSAWVKPGAGLTPQDWRGVPGVGGAAWDWWNYGGPGVYSFEFGVDGANRAHYFGVIADTLTNNTRKLIEIYETGTAWASKVVAPTLNARTYLQYPGASTLNQTGNHLNLAMSSDGNFMALVWLDGPASGTDTLPDIWGSWRRITDANWSTPVNLTQTPGVAEILLHAAPKLKTVSSTVYEMYLGRVYESGLTTWPPVAENAAVFYAGKWVINTVGVNDQQSGVPGSFALDQNYPNPFNPSTSISYTLPAGANVSLKVFNTLGQEVATVVNEFKTAGNHQVDFSAANLASGVYLYTLKAGQYTETKKMVLMK